MTCKKCRKTIRKKDEKNSIIRRLNIIEGQVRGVKQMIEEDRYCDDVLTQLLAINKALDSLENNILENHINSCISRQIEEGNVQIKDEVMDLFRKFRR